MSGTATGTTTFTRTNARHIASKIAADLRQMRAFHGYPTLDWIDKYVDEMVEFLARNWVRTVEYGFRRNGNWVLSLRYEVRTDGTIKDTGAGRVPARVDLTGAPFHSFMSYTSEYWSAADRDTVLDTLPFRRTAGSEPGHVNGYWDSGKSYASGGVGAVRSVWRPT